VGQFGVNAHGEVLAAGRVSDCYLGLLFDRADDAEGVGVLVVAPAALLHPVVPQPDGTVLYELLTGHPDRAAHELVCVADLAVELRAGHLALGPAWPSPRRPSPLPSAAPGIRAISAGCGLAG
jgi:hypothetical protein